MTIYAFLLFCALGLPFVFLILPKGNPIHEILHLPAYWWQLYRMDTRSLKPEKLAYGPHHRQYFIFVPPPEKRVVPEKLVVYFHGGGWKFGRPEQFIASAKAFHEAGYPVILPSLRRIPFANYFDMRKDLNQLVLSITQLQQQYLQYHIYFF